MESKNIRSVYDFYLWVIITIDTQHDLIAFYWPGNE